MTPILQTTQMLIILMLTLIFNKNKQLVDKWTSKQVACEKDKVTWERVYPL